MKTAKKTDSMQKILLTLAVISAIILCPLTAFAHPPKALSCTWNANGKTLAVTATHVVNDAAKHYVVALVVLDAGGKPILTKQYTKQASDKNFSDTVPLATANTGDKVTVRLICNIMGTAETQIVLK